MSVGRVNYGSWVLRVLTWDTMLPACVALVPTGIELLFPNRREVLEVTAVILPIAAFFLRLRAGGRQISSNRCSNAIQLHQFGAFFIGVAMLVMIDCVILLSSLMPKGALFASKSDRMVWAVLFSIYLASMIFAMYPGRESSSPDDSDDLADPAES